MAFLSKYGVARHIYIAVPKAGSANHAVGADWTPVAGDVKISKDGGAAANVTNLPTAIAMGSSAIWDFSLTTTELQAAQVVVTVADSATKAVDDTGFEIELYGNASAQHVVDLADGVRAGLTALPNAAAEAAGGLYTRGTGAGQIAQDANGNVRANVDTIKTNAVVNDGTITFPTTATLASTTNITAGIITTAVNLANAPTAGDFTAAMKTSLNAATPASITGAVGSVTGTVGSVTARVTANTDQLAGSATAATNLSNTSQVNYTGTVTGATTTTTLIDSGLTQADTDFWKGRIVIFLTGALKFQATDVTAFTPATDQLTFTALTAAPGAGDTYVVL